jgi:hypothetical protein
MFLVKNEKYLFLPSHFPYKYLSRSLTPQPCVCALIEQAIFHLYAKHFIILCVYTLTLFQLEWRANNNDTVRWYKFDCKVNVKALKE